ncbi:hypothetical protein ZEAMMB73_Zm00001d043483 [Zea mays]|uniref:THH1/TOM1/TOM3 domain-containing protein n=1 Tax=Zea mays TaxID=4577 RepID=A0A1D6NCH7_MAIZE|nr:hypothetical protein ZEAMMB73_Zm00001d043483 [Zea mays]
MGRYGPFPAAAGDGGGCLPLPIVAAEGALAVLDGAIATAAFVQIFHFMIGLSNIVFLVYFVSTIIATCQRWICWVHGCGFVLMASPQILLLASFLLLLSFWVDLCHQTNDEDEEDGRSQSHHEALLDRTKAKPGIHPVNIRQRCCPGIQLGSRQKFVILATTHFNLQVLLLSFVVMLAFAILIWVGRGDNPIDSSLLKRVYLDVFSVVVIVLGGALACYGAVLFSKMSKVRSETVSTEKWKVASLAAVSLICFSSSAILALVTNVPARSFFPCIHIPSPTCKHSCDLVLDLALFFSYCQAVFYEANDMLLGSSVPSGFVLWIMREMPHRQVVERSVESRVVTLFRERPSTTQDPQWRTAVTSSNKALKSSPI